MRQVIKERETAETKIALTLNLDGRGNSSIESGSGFLDHMLTLFAKHAGFDLNIKCEGDTWVDYHHTAEDIGITLGLALKDAVGDKKGIVRYGNIILPMDEALILSAIDLSGRCYLSCQLELSSSKVGDFDTELVEEFWYGFARSAECTLHIRQLAGTNVHHIIEGVFKSVARSLSQAVSIDERKKDEIPSTKGVL